MDNILIVQWLTLRFTIGGNMEFTISENTALNFKPFYLKLYRR